MSVRWPIWSTRLLVDSLHNWIELSFKVFLLCFDLSCFCLLIALQELKSFLGDVVDSLLVLCSQLVAQFLIVHGIL